MSDETMKQSLTRWVCKKNEGDRIAKRYFWARPEQAYCPLCGFSIPEYHDKAPPEPKDDPDA